MRPSPEGKATQVTETTPLMVDADQSFLVHQVRSESSRVPQEPAGPLGKTSSGLGVLTTTYYLLGQLAGLGVLSLPWAISQTGWAGVPLLVGSCCVLGYSGTRLGRCWILLEERWPEYRADCRKPYAVMAVKVCGKCGWYFVTFIQDLSFLGVAAICVLINSELLRSVVGLFMPGLSECIWIIILTVSLLPFCLFENLKDFWIASVIGVISVVVVCLAVLCEEATALPVMKPHEASSLNLGSFFVGFSTIVFSFGGFVTFPNIQNNMKNRGRFPLSVVLTFVGIAILYLPVGVVGYLTYGPSVSPNILLELSGSLVVVARIFLVLNNCFTYIIVITALAHSVEEMLDLERRPGLRRLVLRITMVAPATMTALGVPNFTKICAVIGAFCVPLSSLVLPSFFYLRLSSPSSDPRLLLWRVSFMERCFLVAAILTGLLMCVISSWFAISNIFLPDGATSSSCLLDLMTNRSDSNHVKSTRNS